MASDFPTGRSRSDGIRDAALAGLARPLRLTRLVILAERAARAFWPASTASLVILSLLFFDVRRSLPADVVWTALGLLACVLVWGLWRGSRVFRWPDDAEAFDRLDRTMPERPLTALADAQAVGGGDGASEAVWRVHVERMAERARLARAPAPEPRVSPSDRFGLRLIAVTAFAAAVLFGPTWNGSPLPDIGSGGGRTAAGPMWEGWIEPPRHTGKPTLYLADIAPGPLRVDEGGRLSLRFYGQVGSVGVNESVTDAPPDPESTSGDAGPETAFEGVIVRSGRLEITGVSDAAWDVVVVPDTAPKVRLTGLAERGADGVLRQVFNASDDHGVTGGTAAIRLDLPAVERLHGLLVEPEPRDDTVIDVPLPIVGGREEFDETLVGEFADHPHAGLPVVMTVSVSDAVGQTGESLPARFTLPERRFFDPLAAAVAEQRRDILWSRENGPRAARILRALTWRPDGFIGNEAAYLALRVAVHGIERRLEHGDFDAESRDDIARTLWEVAVTLEEGDLGSALERLEHARQRLEQAMREGATDEEIARLVEDLEEAMRDYIRELAENAGDDPEDLAENRDGANTITGDQLREMLDRLRELMEQGRMAEAAELLDMLRQMMENMRVARGGPGQQGGEGPLDDLAETLRGQQGLSDDVFRDLQERSNPNANQGRSGQNQGRDGAEGRGQRHSEGEQGLGEGTNPDGPLGGGAEGLADRQRELRDLLARQLGGLPGAGTPEGEAAREALDRAGEAMERAEESLRNGDRAEALDRQSEAMEALREGIRGLDDAIAGRNQPGNDGDGLAGDPGETQRDPLGRRTGNRGRLGTDENLLGEDDVHGRAREIQGEIRRRSGDRERSEDELDYLRRLLDRF